MSRQESAIGCWEAKQVTSVHRECEGQRGGVAAASQAWFLIATLGAGRLCSQRGKPRL